MWKKLKYALVGLVMVAAVANAQTLSDQVLLLLSRANSWTATQTFTDVTITGTCTGCGGAGGGTVTSIDASVDTELDTLVSVSGGPVTGSGTLAFTLDSQSANLVLAGPSSGAATDPTFRSLVDDDVPDTITIDGTNTVTWASVNKTGSSLADLATISASALSSGSLALARLTDDDTTADLPLVSGGAGGDPVYEALDLTSATAISGQLAAANFPILTGDITTAGGSLTTDLSDTGVTAATYGSATAVGQFTVDAEGRITSASDVTITTAALLSTTFCSDCSADAPTRGSIIYTPVGGTWDELVIGAAGTALVSDGTDISWSVDGTGLNIDVDNATAGVLDMANGGSEKALTAVVGGLVYTDADSMEVLAAGTLGQCLVAQGASAPIWDTCATAATHTLLDATSHTDTAADSVTRGSLIYGNATPAWDELVIGGSGTFLRSDGTDVSWSTNGSGLTGLNAGNISAGTLLATRGGTGITSYTVGDLLYASATTTLSSLAAVASGQVLVSAGTGTAPAWSDVPSLAEVNLTTELNIGGNMLVSATAPSISSGFGTTPSVSAENGPSAFRVDVGTGGAATSGVITLPTAANGWNCFTENLTALAANDSDERTVPTATSTTSVTIENQTISTGAAVAWTASDVVMVSCFAY